MSASSRSTEPEGVMLAGLDGANPLGFLAALGALCIAQRVWPDQCMRMSWSEHAGSWRPTLHTVCGPDALIDGFYADLQVIREASHLTDDLGKNLSVDPERFGRFAQFVVDTASSEHRRPVDLMASFGCEAVTHEKLPRILPTDLHFIFGSGHQNYLETAERLMTSVTREHLHEALIGPWLNRDERLSFRWDPADAREHAFQWTAPGDETTTTTWGANLLAFEGTTMLPAMPCGRRIATTGFSRQDRRSVFRWPVWSTPISSDIVRSLLTLPTLHQPDATAAEARARGVSAVYQSTKIKLGDGANFKWSFTPALRIA